MNDSDIVLENLNQSSHQLNKGLLLLLGLALLLFATLCWAAQRLIDEQNNGKRQHFARLMENIQQQELFLKRLAAYQASDRFVPQPPALPGIQPGASRLSGAALRGVLDLNLNPQPVAAELPRIFALGLHLANDYSAFWSRLPHAAPATLLFNRFGSFDIGTPTTARHERLMERLLDALPQGSEVAQGPRVHWQPYPMQSADDMAPRLLAYIQLPAATLPWQLHGIDRRMLAASLLDLPSLGLSPPAAQQPEPAEFTLIDPSGALLSGLPSPSRALHEGLNFGLQGVTLKLTSQTPALWTGLYHSSYRSYFNGTLWPAMGLLALALAAIGGGWGASRWYRARVLAPLQRAQRRLRETQAFGQAVLDTAPVGLCVVRRGDFERLLENRHARQWPGTAELLDLLQRQAPRAPNEVHLDIGDWRLQVVLVDTCYHGQDALLCAFRDVTRHLADTQRLEQARSSANAASQAKALFLATMSHEIRTPLYGMLGTLELLGLTRLQAQQHEYLQTIQRSSGTLFQLISDVLDVAKIESGQMSIEPQQFCPLDLLEDTLHGHAAVAERRGLLLYACIDPGLPNLLLGDAGRLRQILNNLLSNAIKFTDSGRVVLRVRVLELQNQQASIEWQVTDTGIGISPALHSQLFEPFFQVRDASSEPGAGLGLAICQRLSDMMQGQLQVVSEPGLGSSFSLRLSLQQLPGELPRSRALPDGPPVYVRAAMPELSKSTCDWLNRLGLQALTAPASVDQQPPGRVLIDMLPRGHQPPWPGPCINALSGVQGDSGEQPDHCWVDAHDIRAIAQAAVLIHQGQPLPPRQPQSATWQPLRLQVLVAEDNPLNQAILKEQLEALGCRVSVAANGQQALEQWRPHCFDLVVTDVNMPLINGYELTRELRQREPQLPIIGVTANALRKEGQRCLAAGMNTWIVKPMSLASLYGQLVKIGLAPGPAPPAAPASANQAQSPEPALPAIESDCIQVSEKMRPLFLSTMHNDLLRLATALESGAGKAAAERLHSIAGAMGAVQAGNLARACAELECQLLDNLFNPVLECQVRQLMQRLSELLQPLE
ncbi:response regulator [Pseudomonas sp. NFXW11]|uniref:hybrid sensor histidine kinase/response regulator n=1 Tax=Pseudomonas sp. NFXW11 TaxID=2819531 RepID=UPI003CF08A05